MDSKLMLSLADLAYLVASVLFILGLKGLAHPRTAVRANLTGALGMLIAVVVTLLVNKILRVELIIGGLLLGSVVGWLVAIKIEMTAMPQLVALLNGFGGLASVLVGGAALHEALDDQAVTNATFLVSVAATGLIGGVTFTGSLVAFGKLQEIKAIENLTAFPGQQMLNAVLAAGCVGVSAWVVAEPSALHAYWILSGVALVLGIFLVTPIGGADMPVVIALLNSYSGIAAAATGFVLNNSVLIVSGALVGASGIILTQVMCKAMNRSLTNVLFAKMEGGKVSKGDADAVYAGKVKGSSPEEVAMLFDGVQRVVIVPGYGLAVSQAQHVVRDLRNLLVERGVTVEFAIHPVAGRMPGHMNVLLAEADIPYDALKEMDEINPTFETVDVCLVIGANDVVNPVARTDPKSPIAGMPILDVDKSRTVVVVKRSLSPGFAGIPNPLFAADNTLMLFGDGKKALVDLIAALKAG